MHTTKKRLGALFLAVCLLGSLVFGSMATAWAEGEDGGGSAGNSLKLVSPNSTEDENASLLADLKGAGEVKAEVYLVARATKDSQYDTYSYALTDQFRDEAGKMQLALDSFDYKTMANEAQAIVKAGGASSLGTLTLDGEALDHQPDGSALPEGMYLVQPQAINSAKWAYTFNPSLVALPTKKDVNSDGVIMTSVEDGDWIHAVEVIIKPERNPLYGSLRIEKSVDGFYGEPATFTFHITGLQPDGTTYDNYAAIYYDGTEETASTTVTHILAGTTVTVTEEYEGGRYRIKDGSQLVTTATIEADEGNGDGDEVVSALAVHYENELNPGGPTPYGGHGIENQFTFEEKTGDWVLKATPADELVDEPSGTSR